MDNIVKYLQDEECIIREEIENVNNEHDFDAGESGSYAQNHTRVYIEEVEVEE